MAAVKTTKEMTAIDGCLPQELIIDILLRLPAKTLGRFKSVCKTWNGLISTPSFAKSHLDLSSTTTTNANLTSLLFVRARGPAFSFNLGLCDLVGSDIEGNFFPLPSQSQFLHIMGLSHALLCIQCYSFFHVLNPTTKESSDIPLPTLAPRSYKFGFGFGFVPAIDDYKIVLLTSHPQACNCNSYVFSFRDGQWKELDRCTSHLDASMASMHCQRPPPPSHGGAAHAVTWNWAFYRIVPVPQGYCLLKFDVIKEKFSRLLNLGRVASVCVTQDNILCVCELGNSLVIGKLETEDGDWKPKLRIKPQFPVDSLFRSTSDGYILMRFSNGEKRQLVLVGTNQERPTYHLVKRDCFSYAASYTASLMSPLPPLCLTIHVFGLA